MSHKRIYSFLLKHNILYNKQFGFRYKHSTIDTITRFSSDVLQGIVEGIWQYASHNTTEKTKSLWY